MIPLSVLTLNNGSSSLKYDLYHVVAPAGARILDRVLGDEVSVNGSELSTALESVWKTLSRTGIEPKAVGHRIGFGGSHSSPVRADEVVLDELEGYVPSYPLHLRPQLDIVRAALQRFPDVPQALCFDTAMFCRVPHVARMLPLPRRLSSALRRFGFQGLSVEYIISKIDLSRGRTVVAHLGSGASLCVLKDGLPLDSTMGHSVLGGLMMATRPGDMDPGVMLDLLANGKHTVDELRELLYHSCGLLGVSNLSGDMRVLLEAAKTDTAAREAIELFVYDIIKQLGSMIAIAGGLDRLIFTGGIGERAAAIRSDACRPFAYLGLEVDQAANARNDAVISKTGSRVPVHIIRTDENAVIARQTTSLLGLEKMLACSEFR